MQRETIIRMFFGIFIFTPESGVYQLNHVDINIILVLLVIDSVKVTMILSSIFILNKVYMYINF